MSNLNDDEFGPIQLAWLQSLEAHPERQTTGRLGARSSADDEYCACCLGELLITKQRVTGNPIDDLFDSADNLTDADERSLLHYSYDELGLHYSNGKVNGGPIQYDGRMCYSLSEMNDDLSMPWPEIAKVVREHPRAFFYKKV